MVHDQILTPDLDSTMQVNLVEEKLRDDLQILRGLELSSEAEKKNRDEAIAKIEYLLSQPSSDWSNYRAEIGYLPISKKTELEYRQMILLRDTKGDELTLEQMMAGREITREWVKWGVRRIWLGEFEQDIEVVQCNGTERNLLGPKTMDIIERNKLLYTLRRLVEDYNNLSQEKKLQSSPKSGTDQPTSTVTFAGKNQDCDKSKDANTQEISVTSTRPARLVYQREIG